MSHLSVGLEPHESETLTSPSSYLVSRACKPEHSFKKSCATRSRTPPAHNRCCGWKIGRGEKNATERTVNRTSDRTETGRDSSSAVKRPDLSMSARSASS